MRQQIGNERNPSQKPAEKLSHSPGPVRPSYRLLKNRFAGVEKNLTRLSVILVQEQPHFWSGKRSTDVCKTVPLNFRARANNELYCRLKILSSC